MALSPPPPRLAILKNLINYEVSSINIFIMAVDIIIIIIIFAVDFSVIKTKVTCSKLTIEKLEEEGVTKDGKVLKFQLNVQNY